MYDILIRGGTVIDGTGKRATPADVAIKDGQIVAIGHLQGEALRTIDATGKVVSPGFIDIHSHSDRAVWIDPEAHSKIRQGVTTEVVGNCGSSAVPFERLPEGDESGGWPDHESYFAALKSKGLAVNIAALVGHSSVRARVMNYDRRPPTPDELRRMKDYVRQALEQGAVGFSSGLIYTPSSFGQQDEITELCREVARFDGLYATHLRGEGDTLLAAVTEAIETSQQAGVALEVSHHKAMGTQNWGKVNDTLEMMRKANEGGARITVDVYGYTAGSTNMNSLLPPWMHEGGTPAMLQRLADRTIREQIRVQMVEGLPGWSGRLKGTGWENIMVVNYPPDPSLDGKRIAEVAEGLGKDPYDTAFDMLIEAGGSVPMCIFAMCEADVETVWRSPLSMAGSDGSALKHEGPLGKGKPHPRNYGNFPRLIGEYSRNRKVVDLPTAIYKMSGMPAAKLRLVNRGTLALGNFADIVVFDPDQIIDRATFKDPHQYPAGISHVLVNGVVVVNQGEHTGALPGRVLKRGQDTR